MATIALFATMLLMSIALVIVLAALDVADHHLHEALAALDTSMLVHDVGVRTGKELLSPHDQPTLFDIELDDALRAHAIDPRQVKR